MDVFIPEVSIFKRYPSGRESSSKERVNPSDENKEFFLVYGFSFISG